MKILIAIPNRSLREDLCARLKKRLDPSALDIAEAGTPLLEQVIRLQPQLLVMDILQPDTDGIAVLQALRRMPKAHQPEIVLLNSLRSDHVLNEIALLQPDHYATLPCDVERLAERILFCGRERIRIQLENCTGLEQSVSVCLHACGISARVNGWDYMKYAVCRIYRQPELRHGLTKQLYPEIAKAFGTNAACVERSLRSAIASAWKKEGLPWQQVLFPKRPTSGEFLTVIANYLREVLKEYRA